MACLHFLLIEGNTEQDNDVQQRAIGLEINTAAPEQYKHSKG